MTNLQMAIERTLAALQPSVYESKATGEMVVMTPAYVGPFRRSIIAELVQAAIKYNAYLEQTQIDLTTAHTDLLKAYAETVP